MIAICRTHMVAGAGSVRGCQRLVSHGIRDTEVARHSVDSCETSRMAADERVTLVASEHEVWARKAAEMAVELLEHLPRRPPCGPRSVGEMGAPSAAIRQGNFR